MPIHTKESKLEYSKYRRTSLDKKQMYNKLQTNMSPGSLPSTTLFNFLCTSQ